MGERRVTGGVRHVAEDNSRWCRCCSALDGRRCAASAEDRQGQVYHAAGAPCPALPCDPLWVSSAWGSPMPGLLSIVVTWSSGWVQSHRGVPRASQGYPAGTPAPPYTLLCHACAACDTHTLRRLCDTPRCACCAPRVCCAVRGRLKTGAPTPTSSLQRTRAPTMGGWGKSGSTRAAPTCGPSWPR
jgi:hypothetical protein